jgi:protein TonB
MSEAVRASRTIPAGAWFAVPGCGLAAPPGEPVRAVPRVAREAGRLGVADPARQPPGAATTPRPRGPALLASMALHAALLAALLLTARTVLPPEPAETAVPLVFEPAPDAAPAAPLAEMPQAAAPRRLESPAAPEVPVLAAPSADAVPLSPLVEPPSPPMPVPTDAAPPARPVPPFDVLASPRAVPPPDAAPSPPAPSLPRRMPAPPPVRPVPHLPPPRLVQPSPGPPAARPDGSAREAPQPGGLASGPAAGSQAPPAPQSLSARVEGPSVPPRPLAGAPGNVQPAYPDQARRRGIEGRVVVRATVSSAGRVLGAAVAQGSGSDALDRAALDAVRGYSFTPATRGGVAVDGVADLPFTFRLAG